MRNIRLSILTVVTALLLASCSSIFRAPEENIKIEISNKKPANCRLSNDKGIWRVVAPAKVNVLRSENDLKIYCINKKNGSRAYKVIKNEKSFNYPSKVMMRMYYPKKLQKNPEGVEDTETEDLENNESPGSTPINTLRDGPIKGNDNE